VWVLEKLPGQNDELDVRFELYIFPVADFYRRSSRVRPVVAVLRELGDIDKSSRDGIVVSVRPETC
jgi:hypothetical protein